MLYEKKEEDFTCNKAQIEESILQQPFMCKNKAYSVKETHMKCETPNTQSSYIDLILKTFMETSKPILF